MLTLGRVLQAVDNSTLLVGTAVAYVCVWRYVKTSMHPVIYKYPEAFYFVDKISDLVFFKISPIALLVLLALRLARAFQQEPP